MKKVSCLCEQTKPAAVPRTPCAGSAMPKLEGIRACTKVLAFKDNKLDDVSHIEKIADSELFMPRNTKLGKMLHADFKFALLSSKTCL